MTEAYQHQAFDRARWWHSFIKQHNNDNINKNNNNNNNNNNNSKFQRLHVSPINTKTETGCIQRSQRGISVSVLKSCISFWSQFPVNLITPQNIFFNEFINLILEMLRISFLKPKLVISILWMQLKGPVPFSIQQTRRTNRGSGKKL